MSDAGAAARSGSTDATPDDPGIERSSVMIRGRSGSQADGVLQRSGVADHPHVLLRIDEQPKTGPQHRVIIHDHD